MPLQEARKASVSLPFIEDLPLHVILCCPSLYEELVAKPIHPSAGSPLAQCLGHLGCSGVAHGDPSCWHRLRDRPPQLCQPVFKPTRSSCKRHSCRLLSSTIPARKGDIFKPAGWPVFHSSPWKWIVVPKLLKCSITRKTGTGHACSTHLHDHMSLSGHVLAPSGVKKLFSCISCSISSPRSPVRQ